MEMPERVVELPEKQHYGAIDGFRTFGVIGIILMHILANGDYIVNGFIFNHLIPSFRDFVFLFMVISSFSMCCGYYERMIKNKISLEEFYNKRYARIWPCFALLCLLDLAVFPSVHSLYEVFANMTLCFGLLPEPEMSVIGVGWFLGVVFIFYIIFPFFCYLLSNKRRAWVSFGAALIFNILCFFYFHAGRVNFIYSAIYFFAGGLIYLYRNQLGLAMKRFKYLVLLLCLIAVCAYYIVGAHMPIVLIMFGLFLVYGLGTTGRILQNPITKFLSHISMEMYLCHMVIFRGMERAKVLHLFESEILSYLAVAVGVIAGTVVLAVLLLKISNWGRRMVGRIGTKQNE